MLTLGALVGETTGDLISITVFRGKFELRAFIYFGASVRVQGDHRPNKDGNGTSTIETSNVMGVNVRCSTLCLCQL